MLGAHRDAADRLRDALGLELRVHADGVVPGVHLLLRVARGGPALNPGVDHAVAARHRALPGIHDGHVALRPLLLADERGHEPQLLGRQLQLGEVGVGAHLPVGTARERRDDEQRDELLHD